MPTHATQSQARDADGIALPATPRNNRALLDALKDAVIDTQADRLGVDRAEFRKGNMVHTDPAHSRLDFYADDSSEDRFARQFKGETRADQLARRMGKAV